MVEYLAHSENGQGEGCKEPLHVHLSHVAQRTAEFADAFGCREQGFAAGLLHDLGKYSDQFLRRLEQPRRESSRDHWSMGALAAAGAKCGTSAALAIAGHHKGLDYLVDDPRRLGQTIAEGMREAPERFTDTNARAIEQRFFADGFTWPKVGHGLVATGQLAADMLDVRMLFSALVDADFIETEAHFDGDAMTPRRYRPDGPSLDLDQAIGVLDKMIQDVRRKAIPNPMNPVREQLFAMCVAAAIRNSPGLFTLSAPTGSAKTLAMLAFALHHARRHGMRGVVLVVPFLNIIEQTARIYRDLFSPENGFNANTVLEHHSLANDGESDGEDEQRDDVGNIQRLLAENWDAPIILTTSVQCLESLMANRPSPCRKLHRLARSVILFDEVQTLPPKLAKATLATLSRLADPSGPFRSSVVFATATQPAFDVLHDQVAKLARPGWRPVEIAGDAERMFAVAATRVQVTWRHRIPIALEELAAEVAGNDRVLCIVNLKRHAIRLATELRKQGVKNVRHLSTNMCAAHRTHVLKAVTDRLKGDRPVRLIATQCVEAGVDLDFPLVYRALAPLESIAQAAGRCNRHSLRSTEHVVVFKPADDRGLYPPGYGAGVGATESFLTLIEKQGIDLDATEIINSPERLRSYFRHLYGLSGRSSGIMQDEEPLLKAIGEGNFPEVAKEYRLIENNSINVLVPYDRATFDRLVAELHCDDSQQPGFLRRWMRRATSHAVSLFRPRENAALWNHLEPVQFGRRRNDDPRDATWFIPSDAVKYDPLFGFAEPEFAQSWIA
jgi:CRISPR-associated endonuclease/helicase Cas3